MHRMPHWCEPRRWHATVRLDSVFLGQGASVTSPILECTPRTPLNGPRRSSARSLQRLIRNKRPPYHPLSKTAQSSIQDAAQRKASVGHLYEVHPLSVQLLQAVNQLRIAPPLLGVQRRQQLGAVQQLHRRQAGELLGAGERLRTGGVACAAQLGRASLKGQLAVCDILCSAAQRLHSRSAPQCQGMTTDIFLPCVQRS